MPTWEFLLQKKGDNSWLPLESPTLEILEGEYRLAARSGLVNAATDIQINYCPNDEQIDKPWHRSLTRSVNPQGLLLIVPFLEFTAGTWQFNCNIPNFGIKALSLEVLPAIAWDGDEYGDDLDPSFDYYYDPLVDIQLAELAYIPKIVAPAIDLDLPTELITLDQTEFVIQGGAAIKIMGEAFVSGDIEIMLKDSYANTIHCRYTHDCADSDFFSHIITIPQQSEAQIFRGEVQIHPHQRLDRSGYITSQAITVDCQTVSDPFCKFPLLPFENLPTHISAPRNIKFPELPEFLTLGRKNKSKAVLPAPKQPLPNWHIATAHKIPNYSNPI
jgi:hypothetical protein